MAYHFETGDFGARKPVFLPDKEYGLALDALVKGCADVLLTRGRGASLRVLLGKRRVEPQPDWWFVGGRTRPGETPAEGAARNVKREIGLAASRRRFALVGAYSLLWRTRAQPPETNGTADVSTVFELALTDAEAGAVTPAAFDAKEYADAAWVPVATVLSGDYHPALQQACRDLVASHAYADLVAAARDDRGVAAAARRYVAWRESAPADAAKVRFGVGGYTFVDRATGAVVPRPAAPTPPLEPAARSPLDRGLARCAVVAVVAFAAGRLLRPGR